MKNYRNILFAIVAGLVLLTITFCAGSTHGSKSTALKAIQDSLVVVKKEKKLIQAQRDSIGSVLKFKSIITNQTRTVYIHDKNNVSIKGDSAYDSAGVFIQVIDKRISNRIADSDKHITSLESELASAKYALRVDTVFIAKQSQETDLNHSIAKLSSSPRISHGIQAGAGYCRNTTGGTPCLYVGYGYSFRF